MLNSGCGSSRLALLVFATAAIALMSVPSDASALTTTIPPAQRFVETVSARAGDSIECWWSADGEVWFSVIGPGELVLVDKEDTSGSETVDVDHAGTYTFTWENLDPQTVTLSYNLVIFTFPESDEGITAMMIWMFWGMVIGGIVLAAVLIVVIVLITKGDDGRRQQYGYAQPQQPPHFVPQYAYPAQVSSVCPNCSSPVDAQSVYCSKCGSKLR